MDLVVGSTLLPKSGRNGASRSKAGWWVKSLVMYHSQGAK